MKKETIKFIKPWRMKMHKLLFASVGEDIV